MSERRPHWDDYLLASVMIHCNDIYQCHAVIAAVEDAWVQKVTTQQGVRVALGPLVYVKPATVDVPYPVTENSGEWLFRRRGDT